MSTVARSPSPSARPQLAQHVDAGHPGHQHAEKNQIEPAFERPFETVHAVVGRDDLCIFGQPGRIRTSARSWRIQPAMTCAQIATIASPAAMETHGAHVRSDFRGRTSSAIRSFATAC